MKGEYWVSGAKESRVNNYGNSRKVSVVVETNNAKWSIKEGRPQRLKVFSSRDGDDDEVEEEVE